MTIRDVDLWDEQLPQSASAYPDKRSTSFLPVILDFEAGVWHGVLQDIPLDGAELPIGPGQPTHKNVPTVIPQMKCRIGSMLQQNEALPRTSCNASASAGRGAPGLQP
jgi:hypothetical protein